MINPFRSEADAFRLLLGAVVYFGAIAAAAIAGGFWPGLIVFIVLTVGIVLWWVRARRAERLPQTRPSAHADGRASDPRRRERDGRGRDATEHDRGTEPRHRTEVLVCTPALNSRLRFWASDEDSARVAAQQRLDASLDRLRSLGIDASGEVGDANPLQAMEDALRTFGADEIIISTHPEGRSHWLERGVVVQARERFAVPITHVVVDLDRERAEAHSLGRFRPPTGHRAQALAAPGAGIVRQPLRERTGIRLTTITTSAIAFTIGRFCPCRMKPNRSSGSVFCAPAVK